MVQVRNFDHPFDLQFGGFDGRGIVIVAFTAPPPASPPGTLRSFGPSDQGLAGPVAVDGIRLKFLPTPPAPGGRNSGVRKARMAAGAQCAALRDQR